MPSSRVKKTAQTHRQPPRTFDVHAVSESTGSLAEHITTVTLSQFPRCEFELHRHMFCNSISKIRNAKIAIAKSLNPIVLSAIASPDLKRSLKRWCERKKIPYFSLLDGVVDFFAETLHQRPKRDASRAHRCNEDYFRRIDAWEFTLQHDDSRRLDSIDQSDIVIVGVSRVGKTPLAAYLGSLGYRVANVAIAPESPVPRQLSKCRKRAVGLTVQPKRLAAIRERRFELNRFKPALRRLTTSTHDYLTPRAAVRDLMFANETFDRLRIPILDVTDLTVEESAAHILQLLKLKD